MVFDLSPCLLKDIFRGRSSTEMQMCKSPCEIPRDEWRHGQPMLSVTERTHWPLSHTNVLTSLRPSGQCKFVRCSTNHDFVLKTAMHRSTLAYSNLINPSFFHVKHPAPSSRTPGCMERSCQSRAHSRGGHAEEHQRSVWRKISGNKSWVNW